MAEESKAILERELEDSRRLCTDLQKKIEEISKKQQFTEKVRNGSWVMHTKYMYRSYNMRGSRLTFPNDSSFWIQARARRSMAFHAEEDKRIQLEQALKEEKSNVRAKEVVQEKIEKVRCCVLFFLPSVSAHQSLFLFCILIKPFFFFLWLIHTTTGGEADACNSEAATSLP